MRGEHSCGLSFAREKSKGKYEATTFKKAQTSGVFLSSKEVKEYINENSKPIIISGHTRQATHGSVVTSNAQPFLIDTTVAVHNGTIEAFVDKETDISDSKFFLEMVVREGIKPALEKAHTKLKPAYAVIWYDIKKQNLNIIRNMERPLFIMESSDKSTLFWASERRFLEFIQTADFEDPEIVAMDTLHSCSFNSNEWTREKITVNKFWGYTQKKESSHIPWWEKDAADGYNVNYHKHYSKHHKKEKKKGKAQEKPIDNVVVLGNLTYKNLPVIVKDGEKRFATQYEYYNRMLIPVHVLKNKLSCGCYGCYSVPEPHEDIYWKDPNNFLCQECFKGGYMRHLEGYADTPFEDMYQKGKLIA